VELNRQFSKDIRMNPKLTPEESAKKMLAALWERNLPMLRDRLAQLDAAADAAATGKLTPELRHDASSTAHKLAGSLGMFGYQRGTEFARKMEVLLNEPGPADALSLRELADSLRESVGL
jgi:HPt (histidine-containing phosphotransfer) domain-containing protein